MCVGQFWSCSPPQISIIILCVCEPSCEFVACLIYVLLCFVCVGPFEAHYHNCLVLWYIILSQTTSSLYKLNVTKPEDRRQIFTQESTPDSKLCPLNWVSKFILQQELKFQGRSLAIELFTPWSAGQSNQSFALPKCVNKATSWSFAHEAQDVLKYIMAHGHEMI